MRKLFQKRGIRLISLLVLIWLLVSCSSTNPPETTLENQSVRDAFQTVSISFDTGKFAGQTVTGHWLAKERDSVNGYGQKSSYLSGLASFEGFEERLSITITTLNRNERVFLLKAQNENNDARACGGTWCFPAPQLGDSFIKSGSGNSSFPIPFTGKFERESASGTLRFESASSDDTADIDDGQRTLNLRLKFTSGPNKGKVVTQQISGNISSNNKLIASVEGAGGVTVDYSKTPPTISVINSSTRSSFKIPATVNTNKLILRGHTRNASFSFGVERSGNFSVRLKGQTERDLQAFSK